MSTSEKNTLNTLLVIVWFVAIIYLYVTPPLNDFSLNSVIAMGGITLQVILKYVHDYRNRNQADIESTWLKIFMVLSSLFIILYLFWVEQLVIVKFFFWVIEGFLFYSYTKKLIFNKLDTTSK